MVFCVVFFGLLGPHWRHMDVPRLGFQIRAAVAGLHHSHSNLGSEPRLQSTHSSRQRQILNPLSEARDRTRVLMDASWVR